MRVHNTDYLYAKIKRHILLTESYTEILGLDFIIKSCRLKPYQYLCDQNNKLVLHDWWIDEFGNSLKILKNKKIQFIFNDLKIDNNKIICSDLYYGLSISKIQKISKLLFIYYGKDEDTNNDFTILAFLGIDNYLRCFMHLYDEWQVISPLYLGLKNLQYIYKYLDIKNFILLKNKKNALIPCINGKTWISYLPLGEDAISSISRNTNKIIPILLERN